MGADNVYPCSREICNIQKPSGSNKKQQQQAAANDDPKYWTFVIIFVNILT